MSDSPTFRDDLYQGTASYYDQFRLRYPAELLDDLCRRASVTGSGRLLDLASGPGTVTFDLCNRFADVVAVDLEPETIEFAAHKAAESCVRNVQWMTGRAEDVDTDEEFDLVTIGTAFHRLDRRRVADRARHWLRSGGHLALLWAATPIEGSEPWQHTLVEIVVDWTHRMETIDRVPADLADHITELPHTAVLENVGFVDVERHEFSEMNEWTVAELIGLIYSTSLLPRAALGDRTAEFEADLDARLRAVEPSGTFRENTSFAYDLAYRPSEPTPKA